MSNEAEKLLERALLMNDDDRALLAERLIASLDPKVDEAVELAWQKEVQKRASELESGKVKSIPWEDLKDKARDLIRDIS